MNNFVFHNPTKLIFGKGQLKKLAAEIPVGAKVLILYGGGSIKKSGLLAAVQESLQAHTLGEFGGIEPNPAYETLMKAVQKIRTEGYDFLLAVGGGSIIDGTKFIAAAVPFTGKDPWDILAAGAPVTQALPFGTILTLPATGSEMNCNAVITRREYKAKQAFVSPLVYPQFSILDPIYTYTLPPRQIGNGVVDTFVHVAEQYLTYPVDAKLQDRFAEGLFLTLIENGPKALADPENYDVRANLMLAATLALNGLIACGVPQDWMTHAVGHELTALYGLDHGCSLAVVLPSMLKLCREGKKDKLLQFGERVWNITTGSEQERIDLAIAKTRTFFEEMGLPTTLSAYGLERSCIDEVADKMNQQGLQRKGERNTVTPELIRQVLREAYE